LTLTNFEFDLLAFIQASVPVDFNFRMVDKQVLGAISWGDETIALF